MKRTVIVLATMTSAFALLPSTAAAFDSGSTGADSDFNPQQNTEVVLPPNGILNYRSINIPPGVIVRFKRNATNTPVTILVAGDAVIAGMININGESPPLTGQVAGNDDPLDDGFPGKGGPGGFDGGWGGLPTPALSGSKGLGPGGGGGGGDVVIWYGNAESGRGGGAGHSTLGHSGVSANLSYTTSGGAGGTTYGSDLLLPLVGGSGGGGSGRGRVSRGEGGAGGGGALLLAVTGSLSLTGSITANGGDTGLVSNTQDGRAIGGAGSGGAIRVVATTIIAQGTATATGGRSAGFADSLGAGGYGRIRIEADNLVQFAGTNPPHTFGAPGPLFVAGQAALRFATVAGIPVPASPTGSNDVTVPAAMVNPATITLGTTGIPVGSTVKVSVIPQYGAPVTVDSPPTAGSLDNATTSVSVDIPFGNNVLSAQISYTVVAAAGDAFSRFAQGERVEKVTLTSTFGQGNKTTLHTVSGKQFDVDPALLALAAMSQ